MAKQRFLGRRLVSATRLVRMERKVARAINRALATHERLALQSIRAAAVDPFNLDLWDTTVDDEVAESVAAVLEDAASGAIKFLNLSPDQRAKLLGQLDVESQALTFVDRIKGMGPSIADRLRESLNDGLGKGESIPDLSDRIQSVFSVGESRGEMIARTEVHGSAMEAGHTSAGLLSESGFEIRKVWLTTLDGREREAHADADGQEVGYDEPFDIDGEELMYPGDQNGSAANVINCRCDVIYDTPEGLGVIEAEEGQDLEEE